MKILELDELAKRVKKKKTEGFKIIHCHGVFDLLHIGHIRYFEQAASMGDFLVVTLTPDRFVDKGPHRPAFTEKLRAEAVASLNCVDYVAVNQWPTSEKTLERLRPDVYVKGSEFKDIVSDKTGKIQREKEVADALGIELAFTEDIVFSSTSLINRYLSSLPEEMDAYLKIFRSRYELSELETLLERMKPLKILVVGDTILDEYVYCEPLGKSTKDPALTVQFQSQDLFAGGVLAVANHVSGFAGSVDLASVLGELDSQEDFIRSQLSDRISFYYERQKSAPTIMKRRFVDGYSFTKLFEIYVMNDSGLSEEGNQRMCAWLESRMDSVDMVIASDFGHGTISDEMVALLCDKAPFLAVNTQANSGNRGFHTITRYTRADYVCIAEHEIRLETRNRTGDIRPMMRLLSQKLGTRYFTVTRGRKGSVIMDDSGEAVSVPALAMQVVDRVGAGDTVLSVTSMAAFLGASKELLGFLGNAVGALAVGTIGNEKAIDAQAVRTFITSLMK